MSMLAEKRVKKKWCLNPNGKEWSEDGNKFGQRMLEKMGWKKGCGLGVNLQGMKEHVKVSAKNDLKGLGCDKKNEAEWSQHQLNFDSLLAELSSTLGESAVTGVASAGSVSLEEKSKSSRARVHYQKFTRGKDISKYSAKDMTCILGKREENLSDERYDSIHKTHNEITPTKEESGNGVEWYNEISKRFTSEKLLIKADTFSSSEGKWESTESCEILHKQQKVKGAIKTSKQISGENTEEKDECSANKVEEDCSQSLKAEKKKRKKKRIESMELVEVLPEEKIHQICSDSEDEITIGTSQERESSGKKSRKRKRKKRESQDFVDEEMPLQGDRSDVDVTGSGYDGDVEESERKKSKFTVEEMVLNEIIAEDDVSRVNSVFVPFETIWESNVTIQNSNRQQSSSTREVNRHSIKLKAKLSKLRLTEDNGTIVMSVSGDHTVKQKKQTKRLASKEWSGEAANFEGSNLSEISGYGGDL